MGKKRIKKSGREKAGVGPRASAASAAPDRAAELQRGIELQRAGRLDEARQLYERLCRLDANDAEALHLHGLLCLQEGSHEEALRLVDAALALKPEEPFFHNNRGVILKELRRLDEAESHFRKASALSPRYAAPYTNLSNLLKEKGDLLAAEASARKAIDFEPENHEAYNNLGLILQQMKREEEAVLSLRKAIELRPDVKQLYANLGDVYRKQGNLGSALALMSVAREKCGDTFEILNNIGTLLKDLGRIDEALDFLGRARSVAPENPVIQSNCLLISHYGAKIDFDGLAKAHMEWGERCARPLMPSRGAHGNDPSPDRILRIGYLSPDFRAHSVAFFLMPILSRHDRSRFRIYGYSNLASPDFITRKLAAKCDEWREIHPLSDEEAFQAIIEDKIDILVDLAGHTANNRQLLLARKPAPIQVGYLGYPNTSGNPAIGYRLTDAWADPPGASERLYTEALVRLPESFLCYAPLNNSMEVAPPQHDESWPVTFCSFNNQAKINPFLLGLWARILHEVPGSRLMLKYHGLQDREVKDDLLAFFRQKGITPERIELLGHVKDYPAHMRLYNKADIALDTYPYHGTTTTCDALWMGTPVIVLAGEHHVSRVGVSLLNNVGLGFLIAGSPEAYVGKAVALASERENLLSLRRKLRGMMLASPLMDAPRFAGHLETAYRRMWHEWCSSTTDQNNYANSAVSSQSDIRMTGNTTADEHNRTGERLYRLGDRENALQCFLRAVETDPSHRTAYNNLGVIHWEAGRQAEALRSFVKAYEIDTQNRQTVMNLGEVLTAMNLKRDARMIYGTYLRLNPDDSDIRIKMEQVGKNT